VIDQILAHLGTRAAGAQSGARSPRSGVRAQVREDLVDHCRLMPYPGCPAKGMVRMRR